MATAKQYEQRGLVIVIAILALGLCVGLFKMVSYGYQFQTATQTKVSAAELVAVRGEFAEAAKGDLIRLKSGCVLRFNARVSDGSQYFTDDLQGSMHPFFPEDLVGAEWIPNAQTPKFTEAAQAFIDHGYLTNCPESREH